MFGYQSQPDAQVASVAMAGRSLGELRTDQSAELAEAVRIVLRQVERPRANLGGSGPPGRAD